MEEYGVGRLFAVAAHCDMEIDGAELEEDFEELFWHCDGSAATGDSNVASHVIGDDPLAALHLSHQDEEMLDMLSALQLSADECLCTDELHSDGQFKSK